MSRSVPGCSSSASDINHHLFPERMIHRKRVKVLPAAFTSASSVATIRRYNGSLSVIHSPFFTLVRSNWYLPFMNDDPAPDTIYSVGRWHVILFSIANSSISSQPKSCTSKLCEETSCKVNFLQKGKKVDNKEGIFIQIWRSESRNPFIETTSASVGSFSSFKLRT